MEAVLNFITENKILLIVIAVAIVLLILVSIFGKVKSKKDEEKEKAANNANDDNNTQEQAQSMDAPVEEVAEVKEAEAPVEEQQEEVVASQSAEEVVVEEKPAKKAKKTAKKAEVVEEQQQEEVKEEVAVAPVEEPVEEVEAEATPEEVTEEVAVEAATTEEHTTLPGTVEIYKGKTDFYFSFRASNNILIGRSQGYTTKDACKKGVIAVMNAAKEADIRDSVKADDEKAYKPPFGKTVFEIYEDKEGKYRWRLFAKNQQNILASKGYAAKAGAKRAVQSLKKIAANYVLEDLTKATK